MGRLFWIAFGFFTQLFFAYTAIRMFFFFMGYEAAGAGGMWWNILVSSIFAIPHSVMLYPPVRRWMQQAIPAALYGSWFTFVSSCSMLLMISTWNSHSLVIWKTEGPSFTIMFSAYLFAWGSLLYSLSLTGFGWQTGWTPFIAWFRKQKMPRRPFEPKGAYSWLRHPVYLSFGMMLWFVPIMRLDHLILSTLWTVYLLLGSWAKDIRLAKLIGPEYVGYMARVPGYPFFPGPLGRVKPKANAESSILGQSV